MSEPELIALGRRAAACARLLPGMMVLDPGTPLRRGRVVDVLRFGAAFAVQWHVPHEVTTMWAEGEALTCESGEPLIPDLSDPCTVGGLLALVREAWGDPLIVTSAPWRGDPKWAVDAGEDGGRGRLDGACGATEAEAIVAALEGAPQ